MKHHSSSASFSLLTISQNPYSNEIVERLIALNGQHNALTEQLRELHNEKSQQAVIQYKWHDLENQVVNLRFELECFKQIF